jgi:hypothetical protein
MRFAFACVVSLCVLPVAPLVASEPRDKTVTSEKADEAAAIAKVKDLGGEVARKSDGPRLSGQLAVLGGLPVAADNAVVSVSLIGSGKLKDDDLRCLAAFPSLTDLYLGRTAVSDAGLAHLVGLKHLVMIGLIGTKITDAGLGSLAGLKELRVLYLADTAVSDAGLKQLADLHDLRILLLSETKVTDAGLRSLAGLARLRTLDLDETKITDAGLDVLRSFPALSVLSLDGTAVSDAGLKELGRLENLTILELNETKVTDAGLLELNGLKRLRQLQVVGTRVTDAGVKQLKESLALVRVNRRQLGQRADPDFDVSVAHPAYTKTHPTVLFDEAHANFHTSTGRYKAFADLITNDGYRITPNKEPFTAKRLAGCNLLITANAPGKSGPSPSAFTEDEIDAVANWVRNGGSLLLITDHEPFGSGSAELSKRLGVDMSLRVAVDQANQKGNGLAFSREQNQLGDHVILRGRNDAERVDRVLTFTGQSLKGPAGSVQLLKFADTAQDYGDGKNDRTSAAGRAQGIALTFGRGRVVVMGEAGDLSAQIYGDPPTRMGINVPGCDNRKLALNIVRWLSGLIN